MALPGELRQLLDDDRPRGHVDAERQGLGGKHHLDQAGGEARLDRLLEGRDQAGVVGGVTRLHPGQPGSVVEDAEILVGEPFDVGLCDGPDLATLVDGGQPLAPRACTG